MSAYEEVKARTTNDGVEFTCAMFVEMHGKPCTKLVPVEALEPVMNEGAGFAGCAAAAATAGSVNAVAGYAVAGLCGAAINAAYS